jgi:hypothetical protein
VDPSAKLRYFPLMEPTFGNSFGFSQLATARAMMARNGVIRVFMVNDPKLSDGGGWRAGCMTGERRTPEAARVTAGAVP